MGGGGDASREASVARMKEDARDEHIRQGTINIRKQFKDAFGDSYYKNFENTANEFYKPQLDTQYQASLKNLQAALARNGLGASSAGVEQYDRLERENKLANDQVGETIKNQMNARKSDVANQETVAVGQLQSSGDMNAGAAQAANLIKSQTALPGWSPLGQVFTDASAFLANQGAAERSGNARYNLGVSRWGDNTRRFLRNVG